MNRLLVDLKCDTSSMIAETGSIIRLAHNNGEPIYVSFNDNVPDDMKASCIRSLDYIFGLVGEINPYYYYEVVDFNRNTATKSHITYEMYNEAESNVKSASAYVERISHNTYYTTNHVCINESLINSSSNYTNYVLTHELLHIFGFEDVYVAGAVKNTTDYFDNTFLNVSDIYINSGMISPNDYKFLLSAYTPRQAFANYNQTIADYQILLDNYSIQFFDAVASKSLNSRLDTIISTDIDNSIELLSAGGEKYTVTANGDYYTLSIVVNDSIKESLSGKLKYVELGDESKKVVVLTDINSKYLATTGKFSNSEAVHTNLILYNQIYNNKTEYRLTKLSGSQLV